VKLTDFGLATAERICYDRGTGSISYTPPEALPTRPTSITTDTVTAAPVSNDDGSADPFSGFDAAKHDVWSLGVVFFNLVTGKNPWAVASTENIFYADFLEWHTQSKLQQQHRLAFSPKFELSPSPLRVKFGLSKECDEVFYQVFEMDPQKRCEVAELGELVGKIQRFLDPMVLKGELSTTAMQVDIKGGVGVGNHGKSNDEGEEDDDDEMDEPPRCPPPGVGFVAGFMNSRAVDVKNERKPAQILNRVKSWSSDLSDMDFDAVPVFEPIPVATINDTTTAVPDVDMEPLPSVIKEQSDSNNSKLETSFQRFEPASPGLSYNSRTPWQLRPHRAPMRSHLTATTNTTSSISSSTCRAQKQKDHKTGYNRRPVPTTIRNVNVVNAKTTKTNNNNGKMLVVGTAMTYQKRPNDRGDSNNQNQSRKNTKKTRTRSPRTHGHPNQWKVHNNKNKNNNSNNGNITMSIQSRPAKNEISLPTASAPILVSSTSKPYRHPHHPAHQSPPKRNIPTSSPMEFDSLPALPTPAPPSVTLTSTATTITTTTTTTAPTSKPPKLSKPPTPTIIIDTTPTNAVKTAIPTPQTPLLSLLQSNTLADIFYSWMTSSSSSAPSSSSSSSVATPTNSGFFSWWDFEGEGSCSSSSAGGSSGSGGVSGGASSSGVSGVGEVYPKSVFWALQC
jgi:hypothetical protein